MAASLAGSLTLHLFVIVGISLLGPSLSHLGNGRPPRLTVSLPATPLRAPDEILSSSEFVPPPQPLVAGSASDARRGDTQDPDAQVDRGGAGSIVLSVPEPRYFLLAELDTPPAVIQDIDTDPPELRQYLQGGKLVIQLWIDETGKIVNTEVLSTDLPEPFAASARESFMRAVFRPAKKNGLAVRARISVMVVYQPRS